MGTVRHALTLTVTPARAEAIGAEPGCELSIVAVVDVVAHMPHRHRAERQAGNRSRGAQRRGSGVARPLFE